MPSGFPSVASSVVYAQIGKTTYADEEFSNQDNNVSVTLQYVTFSPLVGDGIQIAAVLGVPEVVSPQDTQTFRISISLSNYTVPGQYNLTANAVFDENCGGNSVPGQVGFNAKVIAQLGPAHQLVTPLWLHFLNNRLWLILIATVIIIASLVVVVNKREDEW
jgi:hypothetical protein